MKVERLRNAGLKKANLKLKRKLVKNSILDTFILKEYTENDSESFSLYTGYFLF